MLIETKEEKPLEEKTEETINNDRVVTGRTASDEQQPHSQFARITGCLTYNARDDSIFLRDNAFRSKPNVSFCYAADSRKIVFPVENDKEINPQSCDESHVASEASLTAISQIFHPVSEKSGLDLNLCNSKDETTVSIKAGATEVAGAIRAKLRQLEQDYHTKSYKIDKKLTSRARGAPNCIIPSSLLFLWTVIIALSVVLWKGTQNTKQIPLDSDLESHTKAPAISHSSLRYGLLLETIGDYISIEDLSDPYSHQRAALLWLAESDLGTPNPSSIPEETIIERYVMAVLYFATNGPNWKRQLDFLTPRSVCDWNELIKDTIMGIIRCEEGSVIGIYIENNELYGTIPTELALLKNLNMLWLDHNMLTGNLPTELYTLSHLKLLSLVDNSIIGTIPTEYGRLSSLIYLGIAETGLNGVTGNPPSELGKLTSLEYLWLQGNGLSESLPTQYSSLTNLQALRLENNALTGSVNLEYSTFNKLQTLRLEGNALTGTLDPIFCNAYSHSMSYFSSNCGGQNPEVICSCCTVCCDGNAC